MFLISTGRHMGEFCLELNEASRDNSGKATGHRNMDDELGENDGALDPLAVFNYDVFGDVVHELNFTVSPVPCQPFLA